MNIRGVEITHKHLGVLLIVWLAFGLSFVDRLAWPPIMPVAMKDMGMTATQAGSYMTIFYVGYVLTQLPGGLLNDRYGYRKVLLFSFLFMGCFTILMGTIKSYEQGLIYRFLAGVGSGAVFSAGIKAVFDWFPAKGRGTALGFFSTANTFGVALANLMIPLVSRSYSWHTAFFVTGGITLITLLSAFFLLCERQGHGQAVHDQAEPGRFWLDLLSLLKNRNLIMTGVIGCGLMWATIGTTAWVNTYINKVLQLSLVETGAIVSLFGVCGFIAKPLGGILCDYFQGKNAAIIFGCFMAFGILLIVFGVNTSVNMLYVLVPLLGVSAFLVSPALDTAVGEAVPRHLVGTAVGFANTLWQVGSITAPLAVGAVVDATHNYTYVFMVLAIGPIAGALLALRLKLKPNNVAENESYVLQPASKGGRME